MLKLHVFCFSILSPFLSIPCKSPPLERIPFRTIGQTLVNQFCFSVYSLCYELRQSSLNFLSTFLIFLLKNLKWKHLNSLWLNIIEIQRLVSEESFSGQIYIHLTRYIVLTTFSRVFFFSS